MKAASRWRPADGAPLRELVERGVIGRSIGVYRGQHAQQDGPVLVLPVTEFLSRLPELFRRKRDPTK